VEHPVSGSGPKLATIARSRQQITWAEQGISGETGSA
jgi:hypothetical protein